MSPKSKGRPKGRGRAKPALGVVGHEMLSGHRPFDRETPIATALSQLNEPPPPLPDDVPEDLAALIQDCLEKDPEKRPANAAAVAVRLGLGDHDIMGMALGLATALNGQGDDLPEDLVAAVDELTPTRFLANPAEPERA